MIHHIYNDAAWVKHLTGNQEKNIKTVEKEWMNNTKSIKTSFFISYKNIRILVTIDN